MLIVPLFPKSKLRHTAAEWPSQGNAAILGLSLSLLARSNVAVLDQSWEIWDPVAAWEGEGRHESQISCDLMTGGTPTMFFAHM